MLYNINKQMRRKTHTHTPSELISDLICCALQVHLFLILQIKVRGNGSCNNVAPVTNLCLGRATTRSHSSQWSKKKVAVET